MTANLPLEIWGPGTLGRTLADNAPSGLALVDAEMCVLYVNPALAAIGGRNQSDLEGHSFLELFDPECGREVEAAATERRSNPSDRPIMGRLLRFDGAERVVEVRQMWVDYQGRTIHFFAVADMSEREMLLRSLQSSEERFRIAALLASDYIYEYNSETGKLAWSSDIGELLGYGPGEMPDTLEGMSQYIHPDDQKRVAAAVARHSAEQTNFAEEYRVLHHNGHYRVIFNRSTPVFEPDGQVRRWVGAVSDVTEARELEKELRQSVEKFRIATGLVSDCIYEWNRERNPLGLEWSSDIDRMLGYEPGGFPRDFRGNNENIHPEDRERVFQAIKRHAGGGGPFAEEYRVRRKDGEYITVLSRGQVIKDEHGVPVRWIGVNTDVTERNRFLEELRESEAKFWSFINESAYGYVEFGLDGTITYANARAEKMLGWKLNENPGMNFREITHPDDLERATFDLGRVFTDPNDGPNEYRVRHRLGNYLTVEINTLPLRKKGRIVGFQSTVLDVTERHRTTEELKRRERILEAVARGAEKFLRSHDWRDNIDEVLADVGRAAEVYRCYLFEIMGPPGDKFVGAIHHWINGPSPQPDMVDNLNATQWRDDPLIQSAMTALREGRVFTGRYRDFSPEVAKVFPTSADMAFQGVPVFVAGELWGAFGFDYDGTEKISYPGEVDIIKTLANTLGAAIQREQAEESIRRSERNYRLVVENLIDVIWTADLDFNFTYLSPSVLALSGFTVEEALRLQPLEILTSDGYQRFIRMFHRVKTDLAAEAAGQGPKPMGSQVEIELKRKDQSLTWVEISWTLSRDPEGRAVGFQGTIRDIARRKQAELSLQLSQEKLRAQYDAIPVPTYTWQREGDDFILVDFNEAAVRITQGNIKQYRNSKASTLYRDNPDIRADLERCYQEKSIFEREMEYTYYSTGQRKFLAVKYAFVAPDQVIAHTEDITDKKLTLERLAEAERQAKQTLSAEVRLRRSKDYPQTEAEQEDLSQYPSAAVRRTLADARIAAQSDGVIMLLGASGVGKTYLAGWIHNHSSRAEGPFFDINCAALTPSLIESELFGHEAGAFTGSAGRRKGLLELSHNGTLFLDEIGDMPLDLQAKLLSFLDTRRFMRLGGETRISVNSRIMVATNRDLPALVRAGKFREDLYYRLNVFTIAVPALAERRDDIPLLAASLLKRLAREMGLHQPPVLSPEAIRTLSDYQWPGNVRELRNTLERELLKTENKTVIANVSLRSAVSTGPRKTIAWNENEEKALAPGENFDEAVDNYMKNLIIKALASAKTKTDAARMLGISRHALNRYCRKYQL